MNNRYRKFYLFNLAIIASLGIFILIMSKGFALTGAKVIIDGNLPLTGAIAAFCGDYPKAFTMGIDDACRELSVQRETFVIDFQDNAGSPARGTTILRKHLVAPPSIYISGVSSVSLAIADELSKTAVPHLMVSFDAFICRNGPNRLRILPSFKNQGPKFIDYAKRIKAKKVFIIAINNSANNDEFAKIVEPGLNKLDIQTHRETYDLEEKDYRTIALKCIQYTPNLIIVTGFSSHIYSILKALRSYGSIKNGNVICCLAFINMLHNQMPRTELINIPFITPRYEISSSSDKQDWTKRFRQLYQKDPSYMEGYAYDTGRIIVAAYKKCGKVDGQSIRKVLPFHGICGDINIDHDGDLNIKLDVAQVMLDGTVRAIK